jgi:hypothetical protein
MIKVTVETPNDSITKIRKDGNLGQCFVDCCRALELTDDRIIELFETKVKDLKPETKKK